MKRDEHCRLFVTKHPDCGGLLTEVHFCLMVDFSIIVVGNCPKCGEKDVGLKYPLTTLYKWAREMRKEAATERKPVKPPLQIVPPKLPKFTDDDNVEAHGLSIIIPPDEPEAA